MEDRYRRIAVLALLLILAPTAASCSTTHPTPPEAAREWEPEVQPILVLMSAALREQGYDTTEINAQTEAPRVHVREVHVDSQVDTVVWDDIQAAYDACPPLSEEVESYCVEETLATAAIASARESLELAGHDCDALGRNAVECWTRYWRVVLSFGPEFNYSPTYVAGVVVREHGHPCWTMSNASPC
jgi:hypothetical protein